MTDQFTFTAPRPEMHDDDYDRSSDPDTRPVPATSVLGALLNEVGRKVRRDPITLEVPERKGMVIRFSPNITSEQLNEWRKRATVKKTDTVNGNYFSSLILANTCEAIVYHNEEVTDDGGRPITFRSEELLLSTGTTKAVDCVRAIYGIDPHVEAAAFKVLEAAGWGEEVEDSENPTKP